jgi:hypothetical protein
MSVVSGGLVLVMVAVVVGVIGVIGGLEVAGAEKPGSTKLSGACCGVSNCRVTTVTSAITMAIANSPAMLAPSSAGVELCHGWDGVCSSSGSTSSFTPVTGSDSNGA